MPTLNWIGKEKVVNHHLDVPFRVLDHVYGFDNGTQAQQATHSGNKIIHGDNLEALKALLPEYEGKIKCIYIDPPYNTGNEGWVYNDNVNDPKMKKWLGQVVGKEAEDLTRHDKWLCMMYPRLKLLHKLLAEDGAIFISIDDNEQANLKLICDEIFGSVNFISNLIWEKKYSPQNDALHFSSMHDFIMVYAKKIGLWTRNLIPRNAKQDKAYKNPDNDDRGVWKASDLTRSEHRDRDYYPIVTPSGRKVYPAKGRSWSRPPDEIERLKNDNRLWFGNKGDSIPSLKRFLSEVKEGVVPISILKREQVGDNQEAKQLLKQLFNDGRLPFDTPKPVRLISHLLQLSTEKNSIILDSFAGSGTTAHAVLNLNKEDGGNRKFILIEMEEYADSITAERVKRVVKGYGEGKSAVLGTGGGFDYYELGLPLFDAEGNLNEAVGLEKIRQYVWYTETRSSEGLQQMEPPQPSFFGEDQPTSIPAFPVNGEGAEHPSFLGKYQDTAYYFHYAADRSTTFDHDFLATIQTKAGQYIIYADHCLLPKDFMAANRIIFKKIPRDITRF